MESKLWYSFKMVQQRTNCVERKLIINHMSVCDVLCSALPVPGSRLYILKKSTDGGKTWTVLLEKARSFGIESKFLFASTKDESVCSILYVE